MVVKMVVRPIAKLCEESCRGNDLVIEHWVTTKDLRHYWQQVGSRDVPRCCASTLHQGASELDQLRRRGHELMLQQSPTPLIEIDEPRVGTALNARLRLLRRGSSVHCDYTAGRDLFQKASRSAILGVPSAWSDVGGC